MLFFSQKQKVLEEEIEQKDTFVASIVHDLKNPLLAHRRILENIIKKSNDDFTKYNCEQMLISTRLMLEMVFSISDTYRYDKGKIKYKFQEVNLFDLTKEVCLELSSLTAEEDCINIKTTKLPQIKADKFHIRRVISNLISNAIKYKQDGSIITIEIYSYEKSVCFQVTNKGTFIPPNIQKSLFQKYSCKNSKFNSHSSGLGLYLSNQIIKGHYGKMHIISSPDGKNTFGFTIPAERNITSYIKSII